jgi:tRNA pseudouridine55 synthase
MKGGLPFRRPYARQPGVRARLPRWLIPSRRGRSWSTRFSDYPDGPDSALGVGSTMALPADLAAGQATDVPVSEEILARVRELEDDLEVLLRSPARLIPGEPEGLLVVDKPRGPTSHDVVAEARRLYATRRVGHAGTLDPMATGVLLLLFGAATKLSPHLSFDHKRYRAKVRFGSSTDTLDALGRVEETSDLAAGWLSRQALDTALAAEKGRTRQLPPRYSALRLGGERAYDLARRGQNPDLEPRPVQVLELELVSATDADVVVDLCVSKGYYVRAFARDLGQRLGVSAHLAELRRTASGSFTLSEAATWPPRSPAPLTSLAEVARRALPVAHLTSLGARKAEQGQRLTAADFVAFPAGIGEATPQAWIGPEGDLVALGRQTGGDSFAVVRGFCHRRSADGDLG